MLRLGRWIGMCAGLATLAACGQDGLSGSVSKRLNLHYDRVFITMMSGNNGGLEVEYASTQGEVCDVLADSNDAELADLATVQGSDFLARVHVTRTAPGNFGAVSGGTLHLTHRDFSIGNASASGNFHVTFSDGSDLSGTFSGGAQVVLQF